VDPAADGRSQGEAHFQGVLGGRPLVPGHEDFADPFAALRPSFGDPNGTGAAVDQLRRRAAEQDAAEAVRVVGADQQQVVGAGVVQMEIAVTDRKDFGVDLHPGDLDLATESESVLPCRGAGGECRMCGGSGWIELGGAGMVHPNVLRNVGYDPDVYSGWAFGFGVERMAMTRYDVDDIRLFFENDPAFLDQFE